MRKTIAVALLLIASALHADELTDRVEKIASSIDATVGVSAIDLTTGGRFALRGDERFPMASVYKLPIALAVLKESTKGTLSLDQDVTIKPKEFAPGHSPLAASAAGKPVTERLGRLVILALGESDNTASDALLRVAGGPEAVTRYLRFLGMSAIDVSRSERAIAADRKMLGSKFDQDERDTATPNAMATLLRQVDARADGLDAISRNFALDILRHSKTGERRIRAGVPAEAALYEKSGTAPGIVNDAGVVASPDGMHRMVMVIFTKGAKTSSEKAREEALAAIARAVYEDFMTRR
jgi:beta-lactamase class A